ncbi:MAG: biopolymer transporter ExbD [Campylobacterota bacterium]|nr:biopolymer transporter ExbD [Campylobacterota bacterium]
MRKKRELIAPDLTPVIDIVFILLIFFMVTSVFKKEEVALALNLPDLHAKATKSDEKSIIVELSKNEFAIDGKKHNLDNALQIFSSYEKSTKILIRIDEKVEYSRVMNLFDKLQQNKLTSFSLVAQENN